MIKKILLGLLSIILGGGKSDYTKELLMEKLSFLEAGEHGVVVAVVPGLRRILLN